MTAPTIQIESGSVEETLAIGREIGSALSAGDVVALTGVLGAGKTHLVKGIATGMGIADERTVNSPTFVLVNEYEGRERVCHLDAYRLDDARPFLALGFEEMCEGGHVVIVEWADRVAEAIGAGAIWIRLEVLGDTNRRLTISCDDEATMTRLRLAVRSGSP